MMIEERAKAFYAEAERLIEETGRFVLTVIGSHTYTIGNHRKGLPELMVVGSFPPRHTMSVLNVLSEKMIERGRAFDEGELVGLGGTHPVCAYAAADEVRDALTFQAGQVLGHEDYAVMQIVYPDASGRWPGDPKVERGYDVRVYRRRLS